MPDAQKYLSRSFYILSDCPSFTKKNIKKLYCYVLPTAASATKLSRARALAPKTWQQDISKLVVANHCYWCDRYFSSVATAKHHVQAMQRNKYVCPIATPWFPHQLQLPKKLQCRVCSRDFTTYTALVEHCCAHLGDFLLQEIIGSSDSDSVHVSDSTSSSASTEESDSNGDSTA